MERVQQRRLEMLAVAVLFTLWGGLGMVLDRRGYTDALYWPDYVVHEVPAGSVLDESGFQVGDRFQTVEGIPVRVMDLEVLRRFSPNGDPFVLVGAPLAYRCALAISWAHREIRTCKP